MEEVLLNTGIFVVSLAALLKGADWFIDSAESIGLRLGIPQFIIGVTIVAFGTSLPELATSIAAVYAGKSEIVIGNVVGSNITNIALVLGLTALFVNSINIKKDIWDNDLPYLWGSGFLLWLTLVDQKFSLFEAILFLVGIVFFLSYSFNAEDDEEEEQIKIPLKPRKIVLLIVGGAMVALGAEYTIRSITGLSQYAGIDPEVIALTAVALGTSLPEVIVSLNAARRGKSAIALGNVLGSNIFNTYAVMGIPALFGELIIPKSIIDFSLPLMLVMTILFGIICLTPRITRWEGLMLLLFYAFFIVNLFDT